ncbi:MAG: MraZ N-terminal domain containing protein [Candidatus Bathyarchaeota archaeon]|nr:MraZ N-terminal domain containing protein [Candidatus Bathyarchaeota archaeon]
MGVGETVSLDEKGRIIIPAEIRKAIGKKTFNVSMADKETIILRAVTDRSEVVKQIDEIKLTGDKTRSSIDFSTAKDAYGGRRDADP